MNTKLWRVIAAAVLLPVAYFLTRDNALPMGWQLAILLTLTLFISVFYLRARFIGCIGGITGDTVGASIELIETALLIVAVSVFYH